MSRTWVHETDGDDRGPGGASRQAAALRLEGVTVTMGDLGELMVDLGTFGWFPHSLPSEAAEISGFEDQEET